jgi:hypothetical protein
LIILADGLFFVDFHQGLVHTLEMLLSETGMILMINPPRGNSMQKFIDTLKQTQDSRLILEDITSTDEAFVDLKQKIESMTKKSNEGKNDEYIDEGLDFRLLRLKFG